jgi:Tfp pilus assembly protein PilV
MHASVSFRTRAVHARAADARRKHGVRNLAAFTILEVVIATAVLALAITTSLTTLQSAFLALDSARKITMAGQIMQTEFEKTRLEDWATVSSFGSSTDLTSTISVPSSSTPITNTFTLTRTVGEVHAEMKQITLTTTWKTYDGRLVSRSYTTYYGKNGLYDYFYNSF